MQQNSYSMGECSRRLARIRHKREPLDQDRAKGTGELLQIPHDAVVVEGEVFEVGHELDALFATLAFYSLSDAQYALALAGALCF